MSVILDPGAFLPYRDPTMNGAKGSPYYVRRAIGERPLFSAKPKAGVDVKRPFQMRRSEMHPCSAPAGDRIAPHSRNKRRRPPQHKTMAMQPPIR